MKRDRAVDSLRFLLILLVFITHLLSLYAPSGLTLWSDGGGMLDGIVPWRGGVGLLNGLTGNFAVCFFTLLIGYFAAGPSEQPLEKRLAKRYLQFFLGMLLPLLTYLCLCYVLYRWFGVTGTLLGGYLANTPPVAAAVQCLNEAMFFKSTLVPTYWCMGSFFTGSAAVMVMSSVLRGRSSSQRIVWTLLAMALCYLTDSWLLCVCLGGYLLRIAEPMLRRAFSRLWVRLAAVAAAVLIVRVGGYETRCYLQALASALLLMSLQNAPRVRKAFSCKALAYAGQNSFYFYLWHFLVQDAFYVLLWPRLTALAGDGSHVWILIIAAACTLILSLALSFAHGWLHRRLMAWLAARATAVAPARERISLKRRVADAFAPAKRLDTLLKLAICVGLGVMTYCLLLGVSERPGDFATHTAWAAEMDFARPRTLLRHVVHMLWHLPVALFVRLGVSSAVAACAVTAAWKVAQFLLLRRLLLRADDTRPVACTLWALAGVLVMSLYLPGQATSGYYWYWPDTGMIILGSPNAWHSPTQITASAVMLLAAPALCSLLRDYEALGPGPRVRVSWRKLALPALTLCLSVLAKPTFFQAFLPAAGVYGLRLVIRRYHGAWRFFWQVLLAFVPAAMIFAFSYLYYGGMVTGTGAGLVFGFSAERLLLGLRNLLLMAAFPVAVLCVCGKGRLRGNHGVWLAIGTAGFALLEFCLFAEQGLRGADGNLGWALMSACGLLWAYALPLCRSWLRSLREAGRVGWPQRVLIALGAALLTSHLVGGVCYLIYLFPASTPM